MYEPNPPADAATVAASLADAIHARGQEYALGGAIALGYWGIPRGTVDVDVTLFLALNDRRTAFGCFRKSAARCRRPRRLSRCANMVSAG